MALRKLQAEIDKTLKTVQQGLETFENLYEKLGMSNSATQKDKIETDLKTQIKKLQRMRDQIKEWLRNNDIKDKSALLENRKQIESQMERFKALEKEMKMKAFSKEGLIAQSKLDPAEKAKREVIDWIGNQTDELSRQIEQTEAEAEALQLTGGKKKKSQGDRLGELETLIENRQWHIGRLEVVQRMLENGQLSAEQVEGIKEDVNYFVEANSEEDFEFDNGIYDDLNLQEEDEFQEFGHNDDGSNLDSASVADVMESTPAPKTPAKEDPPPPKKVTPAIKTQLPPAAEDQPPSPVSAKKQPSRKSTMDSTKAELPKNLKPEPLPPVPPIPAVTTPTSVPQPKPVALPPIRYAAAAAAAVASASAPAPSIPSVPAPSQPPAEAEPSAPSQPAQASPALESPQAAPPAEKPPVETVASPVETSPSPTKETPHTNGHVPPPPGIPSAESPAPPPGTQPPPMLSQNTNGSAAPQMQNFPPPGYANHGESSRSVGGATSPHPQQGVLGNLMQSFDVAKEISERRGNDIGQLHSTLEVSYSNAPHQLDAEPPRYYHPRNPVKTPSHYPQSRGGLMEDKKLFQRLELDQLFFIFYYYPGTYEQWLAAESLKQANWRFHKQYLTWFKRAHNPQAITDEYEQGGYFYFDWENSWCQRKKSDFRFEYRWLSDA